MQETLVLFGAGWIVVAVVLSHAIIPARPRPAIARASGGSCLLGALLGVALLALVLWALADLPPTQRHVLAFVAHAALAAFLVLFARSVPQGMEALGLERGPAAGDVARGVATYVAFIPVVVGAHVLNSFVRWPGGEEVQQQLRELLSEEGPSRVALIATLVVAVPVFEELVFRGLLQSGLRAQLAVVMPPRAVGALSILVASVAFTAMHPVPTYIPVFVLSLILGYAFDRGGRLLTPIALHAAHNLAVVFYAPFSQQAGGGA